MTYIENPLNNPVVNHIDENKLNNKVENLEWVTQTENCNSHTKTTYHERKIIQKDFDDNLIQIHNSITDAGLSIGLTRHSINKVCLGKNKTAGGFKWEYENQEYKHKDNVDLMRARLINDFQNYYIFSDGRIYNKQIKSFIQPCTNAHGSNYVTLSSKNIKKNKYVHNLVATYFIDNPNNHTRVKHIINDKSNNNIDNLEWY